MKRNYFMQWAACSLLLVPPILMGCSQDDENEIEFLGVEYSTMAKGSMTRSVEGGGDDKPTVTTKVSAGSTTLNLSCPPFSAVVSLAWEGGNLTRGPQPKITTEITGISYTKRSYQIESQDISAYWYGEHSIKVNLHIRYYKLLLVNGHLVHDGTIHACTLYNDYVVQSINEDDHDW